MNLLSRIEERRLLEDLDRQRERQHQGRQLLLLRYQLVARWISRTKGIELELTDREVERMVAWVAMQERGLEQELAKE